MWYSRDGWESRGRKFIKIQTVLKHRGLDDWGEYFSKDRRLGLAMQRLSEKPGSGEMFDKEFKC